MQKVWYWSTKFKFPGPANIMRELNMLELFQQTSYVWFFKCFN